MARTEVTGRQIKDKSVSLTDDVVDTLPVTNGGTGNSTITAGAVLVGNGTGAVTTVSPGTSGYVLTSNGTAWVSAAASGEVTLNGSQTLYNKTISGSSNTLTDIPVSALSTTGTAGSTTYLRGDGSWAAASAQNTTYTTTIGNGSSTTITVTHNLGTRNVVVSVKNASTYAEVECDVAATTTNTVTLTFATAPTQDQYTVTVFSDGIYAAPTTLTWLASSTIKDDSDQTKQVKLDVSAVSTGTTRTLSVPDASLTIVGTATTQVITYKDLSSSTNTFPASLATVDGSQALTNKDLSSATNTLPTSVVTLSGAQGLTNKTLTNPTITNYTESVNAVGTVTSSATLSLSSGTVLTITLTASTACTFTMPAVGAGKSFILMLKQPASTGGGSATFTGVKWPNGGTAPTITTTAGKMDILSFVSDGTNWYGSVSAGYAP